MKTIVIVGAGPGLGLSIARKFGQNGFRVALVARNQEKLEGYVQELKQLKIEAAGFRADVLDMQQLRHAFAQIKETWGPVDVLEYSPIPSADKLASAVETTPENALFQFQYQVLGAVASVAEVLPGMLDRGNGALLFTTGLSAVNPVPILTNVGIAMAGLRNYAHCLHQELAPKGVYVGHLSIGVYFQPGPEADKIAALWYNMYEKQNRVEELVLNGQSIPEAIK
ncbi:MAG: short-chain dehydrogenase [Anaerolineae bacterium]|nr:SDR family NAD(P)-dependent oxidoreductase [Anaerolineales bacterium]MCQ3972578.1 short-chain dehydrogenase [Anaerolineae bacterium]